MFATKLKKTENFNIFSQQFHHFQQRGCDFCLSSAGCRRRQHTLRSTWHRCSRCRWCRFESRSFCNSGIAVCATWTFAVQTLWTAGARCPILSSIYQAFGLVRTF
jgi:hypothetical protein